MKLRCWCRESGRCECELDAGNICTDIIETAYDCECILIHDTIPPFDNDCKCVLYPSSYNAPGYVSNTIDVLRRGAR